MNIEEPTHFLNDHDVLLVEHILHLVREDVFEEEEQLPDLETRHDDHRTVLGCQCGLEAGSHGEDDGCGGEIVPVLALHHQVLVPLGQAELLLDLVQQEPGVLALVLPRLVVRRRHYLNNNTINNIEAGLTTRVNGYIALRYRISHVS